MNEKSKSHIVILSNILEEKTFKHLFMYLDGEDTSDLINLIISSHLSSMFTIMRKLASQHEHMIPKVNNYIKEILEKIATTHPIIDIEIINKN